MPKSHKKKVKSKQVGKGGLKCPCCNMGGTLKSCKGALHREQRRKAKQALLTNPDSLQQEWMDGFTEGEI